MRWGTTGLALCIVLSCRANEDDDPPYGAATITVGDAPFVVSRLASSVGRQCSGGFPGISSGDCSEYLDVVATGEGRSLTVRLNSEKAEAAAEGTRARLVRTRAEAGVLLVTYNETTSGTTQTWTAGSSSSNHLERATLTANADGRVVVAFAGVLERAKLADMRVEATVTVDCKPTGADAATCESRGGTPRP